MNAQAARKPARSGTPEPRIATKTAIPTTPPIWRAMLNSALPVAVRSGGRPETAVPASTGKVSATPMPARIVEGSMSTR